MIGTRLIEELCQSIAYSHLVKDYSRGSLLLLAAPENGKTTIAATASCKHVCRIAVISGRSILKEVNEHKHTEVLLFNDLSSVRALSAPATALLVVILNQLTQDERGKIAFAGQSSEEIDRPVGMIACCPFATFTDHRARWKEMGFVSRMIPFSYQYGDELVANIKDLIDNGSHRAKSPTRKMPRLGSRPVRIGMSPALTKHVRHLADARAKTLGQLGIRLLQNYHVLIRAHALIFGRRTVIKEDLDFLRAVDRYVSITKCEELTDRR